MRELTYKDALHEALDQVMAKDERVFLIGEDIGVYGGAFGVTGDLQQKYGKERVVDTPISEAGITGACVGSAITGMRPVGEIMFSDFVVLSMEQLVLQAARIRFMFGGKATVPMVLRLPLRTLSSRCSRRPCGGWTSTAGRRAWSWRSKKSIQKHADTQRTPLSPAGGHALPKRHADERKQRDG